MNNVKRREEKAKLKISKLQQTCKQLKELKEIRKELASVHKQHILKESKKRIDSRKRNIHNLERIRTAKLKHNNNNKQNSYPLQSPI